MTKKTLFHRIMNKSALQAKKELLADPNTAEPVRKWILTNYPELAPQKPIEQRMPEEEAVTIVENGLGVKLEPISDSLMSALEFAEKYDL